MYDLTNVTENVTSIIQVVQGINTASSGLLGVVLLTSIFVVSIIVFKQREDDTKEIFLASSFMTALVGLIMFAMKLIIWKILIIPIILVFASAMIKKFS